MHPLLTFCIAFFSTIDSAYTQYQDYQHHQEVFHVNRECAMMISNGCVCLAEKTNSCRGGKMVFAQIVPQVSCQLISAGQFPIACASTVMEGLDHNKSVLFVN